VVEGSAGKVDRKDDNDEGDDNRAESDVDAGRIFLEAALRTRCQSEVHDLVRYMHTP
jgi:hypothetical protein